MENQMFVMSDSIFEVLVINVFFEETNILTSDV